MTKPEILSSPRHAVMDLDIRAAANAQGRAEYVSLWSGQAAGLATTEPAGDVVRRLQRELEALL